MGRKWGFGGARGGGGSYQLLERNDNKEEKGGGGAHVEMTQVIIIIHNYNLLNPDRVSLTGNRRECFQTHFPKVRRFLLENSYFGLKSGFFKTLYFETD